MNEAEPAGRGLHDRVNLLQPGRITYDRAVGETSVGELTELVASDYRRRA